MMFYVGTPFFAMFALVGGQMTMETTDLDVFRRFWLKYHFLRPTVCGRPEFVAECAVLLLRDLRKSRGPEKQMFISIWMF